ncbi:MAG: triose-phosphate isomerase [bacterium]|nr:triose-phosphate isomerase [bacterium]MDZ4231934.1 triose-phosphate isomerase [Candidatus Pacearchaeota archaeon]
MSKKYYIANWKMNPDTLREARALALSVARGVKGVKGAEVVICPSFVFLGEIGAAPFIKIGAQDCFWEKKGAYTGEVSPIQLRALGCSYVILGHSERRQYLGETAEQVKAKIRMALVAGLRPVVCVGEEKKGSHVQLGTRLKQLIKGLDRKDAQRLLVVYEPVWAISTTKGGREAEASDLAGPVREIRRVLRALFGSRPVPVLYGGSVEPDNVADFMGIQGIDGVLVGGASLKASEFSALVRKGQGR